MNLIWITSIRCSVSPKSWNAWKAAERRAYEYEKGYKDPYDRIKSVDSFTDKAGNPKPDKRNKKGISFRNTPSFPIRYDVLDAAEPQDHQKSEISGVDHADSNIIEAEIVETPVSDAYETSNVEPMNGKIEVTEEIPDTESTVECEAVQTEAVSETVRPDVDMIIPQQDPGRPSLCTEPSAYLEIIKRAMKRSACSEEDSISFTEEEMRQLLTDPEFCRLEKDLAKAFRDYLTDSG